MFEDNFSSPTVYAYTGAVTPTTPCVGFNALLDDVLHLSGGPPVNDALYATPGSYSFVVTSSGSGSGLFACHVIAPEFTGNTTNSNLLVDTVSNGQDATCSPSGSSGYRGASFSWTQATTGFFDINIYFANTTFSGSFFYASAALYARNVILNPNGTVYDLCALNPIISSNDPGYFAAILQNVSLTAGTNYTAVFSGGSDTAYGYWGATVDPTYVHTVDNSPGTWTQPSRSSGSCTSSSYTTSFTYIYTFIASNPTYIFDTQRLNWGTYIDTYSFLYTGINNATVPATCSGLIYQGDTGDIRPISYIGLVPGQPYTLIVSGYSDNSRGIFGLYAYSGNQIGVVPTTGVVSGTGTTPVSGTGTSGTSSGTSGTSSVSSSSASSTGAAASTGPSDGVALTISAFTLVLAALVAIAF